jgi:hypothetical protein
VDVAYDWKAGVIQLHPVGDQLVGTWTQSNGTGNIELTFDSGGKFQTGRWDDARYGKWFPAFLR